MIRRFVRDESGMTLSLAFTMIALIGVMGAGLLAFVMRDIESVVEVNRGQQGLDIAEAGVQAAKSHLRADNFRQHYDTDRANDCTEYDTEPGGGPRVGGDNWSKATQIYTDSNGSCGTEATRTDDASTPWREDQGVTKCFPDSNCDAVDTGRFHVTIECFVQNPETVASSPCQGGATRPDGTSEPPPESNVPASDRKFFKITSTGYDDAAGDGAIRKVEAIYYTAKKGNLPIAFFTPGNIDFMGGGAQFVRKLSLFAGGNITGTQTGSGQSIADRCTSALYNDWYAPPYNDKPRVEGASDPCSDADAVINGAGFGAVGLVCGTSQCDVNADSVADGYNDYDRTTGSKGQNKRFVYKEDASGNPDPRGPLDGDEISFPFDPGTSLEPGQAHTIIGLDLQGEMAAAACKQGNYYSTTSSGGCSKPTTATHKIESWPVASPGQQVIYFVDGADVDFRVNTGKDAPKASGVLVVRGGDLTMSNSSNGFEGVVIVIGNGIDTGLYTQGGQFTLDGYVAASGNMKINGNIDPDTTIDYTNLLTFRDVKLWSWRELYE